MSIKNIGNKVKNLIKQVVSTTEKENYAYKKIYRNYAKFTMIPEYLYIENLRITNQVKTIHGDVVECGVWRGGMSAGMAEVLGGDRNYYLFDSFEGLPEAKEIDGQAATKWQNDKESDFYYNNCMAEVSFAETAMSQTGCDFKLIKGWFNKTIPEFNFSDEIAVLRLDGDWYESTMTCLQGLYPKVVENGIIIIDDYFAWDGCSKAVHDYLSEIKSNSRIRTFKELCYIIKTENGRQY
jgi:O-methyltransferase